MLVGLSAFEFDLLLLGLGSGVESLEDIVGEAVNCLPALVPAFKDACGASAPDPVDLPFSFSHLESVVS